MDLSALKDDNSIGRVFDFAGPKIYTHSELCHLIAKSIDEPLEFWPLMRPFTDILGFVNEFTWKPSFTRDYLKKSYL